MQRIITLTTDFGYQDYYVGALKGKMRSVGIASEIIDISHAISFYNIDHAGFVIAAAYKHFPKGTIHVVGVSCEITETVKPILMQYDGHYFLAADNGVLSFLNSDNAMDKEVYLLKHDGFEESLDVFVHAVKELEANSKPEELGECHPDYYWVKELNPSISSDQRILRGNVIYEDHFGNAITNIERSVFEKVGRGRSYVIKVKNRSIRRINRYYADFKLSDTISINDKVGDLLAIFNDLNYLQISIFHSNPRGPGSPRDLIGLELRDSITIEFIDEID